MALSKIDAVNFLTGTIPSGNIATSSLAAAATGKVLQVQSTTKTNSFNSSSTSLVDITGLSVSITPASTSNKVYILANIQTNNVNGAIITTQLVRGSTEIAKGTVSKTFMGTIGNYSNAHGDTYGLTNNSLSFLDSPSASSSTTYKLQIKNNGGGAMYVNNRGTDDSSYVSTITAFEIAG